MSSLTQQNAIDLIRLKTRDGSAASQGISDANLKLLIEEARQFYCATYPEQFTTNLGTNTTTSTVLLCQLTLSSTKNWRNVTTITINGTNGERALRVTRDLAELLELVEGDGVTATPTHCYPVRHDGSETIMDVYLYPIPDASYTLKAYGTFEPTPLSSTSDPLLFGNHGSRVIANIAAVEAARIIGRTPEFVQGLIALLPDRLKTRMAEEARYVEPFPSGGKAKV